MTPAEHHRAVAAHFTGLVRSAPSSSWDQPAPVPGWVARDVVRHLVEWLPALLSSSSSITLPGGPSVDDDPVAAWTSHADAVQAVLDDPATADAVLSNPHIGERPVAEAIDMIYTSDVFMHTWDLARATGQRSNLDPQTCEAMLAGMEQIEEMLRASGQYGPRVPIDSSASAEDRLMAFVGRDPEFGAG